MSASLSTPDAFGTSVARRRRSSVSDNVVRVTKGLLLLAAATSLVLNSGVVGGEQAFAVSGLAKRVVLPLAFVAYALVTMGTRSRPAHYPFWWVALAVLVGTSTIMGALFDEQPLDLNPLAQGLALLLGLLVVARAGLLAHDWNESHTRSILATTFLFGALSAILDRNFSPFAALTVPTVLGLLYLAVSEKADRGRRALLGLATAAGLIFWIVVDTRPLSEATVGQLVVGTTLIVLAGLPMFARRLTVYLTPVLTVVVAVSIGLIPLLTGTAISDDVTLSQRSYETTTVREAVDESLTSQLVGLGPAATIDLSGSPDAVTLANSGRDLKAVDDVHLLTTYLLLKLGIAGVIWLVLFLGFFLRVLWREIQAPVPGRIVLLLFAACGLIEAFPAATYLFANPLPPLFLGILWATRRTRRGVDPMADDGSGAGVSARA